MENHNELVKALRYTAEAISEGRLEVLRASLLTDAAAAIEALQAELDQWKAAVKGQEDGIKVLQAEVKRLELDNEDYEHENRRLNGENESLRENADEYLRCELEELKEQLNDADVAADDDRRQIEELQTEVKRLEPKRGEWIKLDMHKGMEQYKCSVCEAESYVPECMGEPMYAYCPNCGAIMRTSLYDSEKL